ncbi:MAG: RHS repeat-associated core domain-containing protein [Hyphomicrobium sp.]
MHSITGSETLNARFPGQWFQVESGLHYNWHRHYDPAIGRYTQPDPLGFVDGPSVYAYVKNSPGELVDPDGRMAPAGLAAFCARFPKLCANLLKCARNPKECAQDQICPILPAAKTAMCSVPGCGSPSMQPELAHGRMRAAEACLALRDAETAFCPGTATKKHQNESLIREQELNKIKKCQNICGGMQVYPPLSTR